MIRSHIFSSLTIRRFSITLTVFSANEIRRIFCFFSLIFIFIILFFVVFRFVFFFCTLLIWSEFHEIFFLMNRQRKYFCWFFQKKFCNLMLYLFRASVWETKVSEIVFASLFCIVIFIGIFPISFHFIVYQFTFFLFLNFVFRASKFE